MISVVIPTFNEEENIAKLIAYLQKHGNAHLNEIIISDGGSSDKTIELAEQQGARVLKSPRKGRAAQMNYGASIATGDILYFVHADTIPPTSYQDDIVKAINAGFKIGRYQTRFDTKKFVLRLNAFFTRFDLFMCYGGDQTLFVERGLFDSIGGFKSEMRIMEDYEITERARKIANYKILPGKALISARKYDTNSWLTVQKANYTIVQMYKKGASQEAMVARYKELLQYR